MAPPNLQGLNLVYAPETSSLSDADLLASSQYPDLSTQLDLWTNLKFDSDEPAYTSEDSFLKGDEYRYGKRAEDLEEDPAGPASHDAHDHVVTGQAIPQFDSPQPPASFDLNNFLTGFGIDPYSLPPSQGGQLPSFAPSLAQLMALHQGPQPLPAYAPVPEASSSIPSPPPTKRARTSRKSEAAVEASLDDEAESPTDESGAPLSMTEDKRRRNTAASARFRLKKKEREQALEGKAKELETRVNELERECEGLRRENGWLKGLVVGATGGTSVHSVPIGATVAGMKRPREEVA